MSKKKTPAPTPASAQPTPNDLALLGQAVDALVTNTPMMTTRQIMHLWLHMAGGPYVEFHEGLKDSSGNIACRATAAGKAYSELHGRPAAAPAQQVQQAQQNGSQQPAQTVEEALSDGHEPDTVSKSEFVIENNIPIPAVRRFGATRGSGKKWPFLSMLPGQSFFIPKTDENSKPAKRIAALVSLAQRNNPPMRFRVAAVAEAQGEGARIWRVADFTAEEVAVRNAPKSPKTSVSEHAVLRTAMKSSEQSAEPVQPVQPVQPAQWSR